MSIEKILEESSTRSESFSNWKKSEYWARNFCEDYTDVFLDMFKDRATVYSDVLFREDRDIA
ncbi:hypothetical protein D6825_02960, partial [Candidatus Woesearchaeota archaeon]